MPPEGCPLCGAAATLRETVGARRFFQCEACRLLFLHPLDRLGPEAERAHYATHENDADDPGYRRWLGRLVEPLVDRLAPGAQGLDFGCGPAPALASMLTERGFPTAIYDPFFAPDESVLSRRYDFVTCTETAEHFHDPRRAFERLAGLIEPGGLLAVMTQLVRDDARLADWRYARDPTHTSLYTEATLSWIAAWRRWRIERVGRDIALFYVPTRSARGV